MTEKLDNNQSYALRAHIEEAILKQDLTNEEVASRSGVDERTIRNVRTGKTLVYATFQKVCLALGIPIDDVMEQIFSENAYSSSLLGGYRLPIFSQCVGIFVTIRPLVGDKTGAIERYRTEIRWSRESSCLVFQEFGKRAEKGEIYIPPSSAFLYMMTIRDGYVRTVVASTMHHEDQEMYGAELAQLKVAESGNSYVPVLRPIVFIKDVAAPQESESIDRNNAAYSSLVKMLQRAEGYVQKISMTL